MEFNAEAPFPMGRGRYFPRQPGAVAAPTQPQLTDAERANIAESLAAAAERLDDLPAAEAHLRTAIGLRPLAERDALQRHLNALVAEQNRRAQNAARQPIVKNVIEQDQIVRPRISRSAPRSQQ